MGLRLNLTSEPRWVDLIPGVRMQVSPVTTSVMAMARRDAGIDEMGEDLAEEEVGLAMVRAVARRVVLDWEGVGDEDGAPLPVSPEGVDALLEIWPVFEAFQNAVLGPQLMLEQEKNDSALSPNGTSEGATATAKPAKGRARRAPRA